jgi:3-oxoacyl-[acyl-carrier-protein] synthase-1
VSAGIHIGLGGLCCPVGLELEPACAAIRAGIDRLDVLPWRDDAGLPIVGAAVPGLEGVPLVERMLHMLASVIAQAAARERRKRIERCLVAWPDRREAALALEGRALAAELARRSGVEIAELVRIVGDETSAVRALGQARDGLQDSAVEGVLVCAVDSLLDPRTLATLAEHARLRTLDESDGIAPGEAAAAVWVGRRPAVSGAHVLGIGFAHESATVLDDRPLLGLGMSAAIREALGGLALDQVDYLISDLGGEHYHFLELSLANSRAQADTRDVWHPAEFIGSVGVAAAPLSWIIAGRASAQGWSRGPKVLCTTSAERGERAAVLLDAPMGEADASLATRPRGDFAI